MNAWQTALTVALVAGAFGLAGALLTSTRTARNQRDAWLRQARLEAYSELSRIAAARLRVGGIVDEADSLLELDRAAFQVAMLGPMEVFDASMGLLEAARTPPHARTIEEENAARRAFGQFTAQAAAEVQGRGKSRRFRWW